MVTGQRLKPPPVVVLCVADVVGEEMALVIDVLVAIS